MIVVDSTGWVEYFVDGELADAYADFVGDPSSIVTPTIVLYEVYKIVRREEGDGNALVAAAQLMKTEVVPLTPFLALSAAERSLEHNLAFADASVYATAIAFGAELVTSDADLDGLDGVLYIPHPGRR